MLLHDVGKPSVVSEDDKGFRHFFGHPEISAKMAEDILGRLHADNAAKDTVSLLCRWHDKDIIPDEKHVKRLFMRLSYEQIIMLCKVRMADNAAQNPKFQKRGEDAVKIMKLAERIILEKQCVTLRDLAVNGNDMKKCGYNGTEIGRILNLLLEKVIDGEIENKKEILLLFAERINNNI